jgi:Got1/Sft2-like family
MPSSSSSFGSWYEQQQAAENGDAAPSSSSWFSLDTEQMLPLFNSESLQGFSFESMKQSMEAQMPKKILGMGYQQRFKVRIGISASFGFASSISHPKSFIPSTAFFQVFCSLLFLSALFFALAFFVGVPMLAVKPQKFALSFTCGSLTFIASFGILKGPYEHLVSMFAAERMFFTTIYMGSMFLTLYLTCTKGGLKGYALVLISSAVQLVALLWYLVSFLPGGTMGLSVVSRAIWAMLKPLVSACLQMQTMCVSACLAYFVRSSSSS